MNQLDLTGKEHPAGVKLTIRQQAALDYISARQPVPSDELGAFLHHRRRHEGGSGHDQDSRCGYCADDGRDAGRALARKGLVRRTRAGWVLDGYQAPAAPSSQGDLPEGF